MYVEVLYAQLSSDSMPLLQGESAQQVGAIYCVGAGVDEHRCGAASGSSVTDQTVYLLINEMEETIQIYKLHNLVFRRMNPSKHS